MAYIVLQKMKLPRFTLGMIAGASLSAILGVGVYYSVYFPIASGIHQSPSIPFYILEGDPNYDIYMRLQDPEYWRSLSESAQSEAAEYCRRNNVSADINVYCKGSPQGYVIYYSTGEYTSLRDLFNRNRIESVIVSHIDSNYYSVLEPIIRGEQVGTEQPATRPESESVDSDKPQPEAEGRSR
jgi:hypothetical protein